MRGLTRDHEDDIDEDDEIDLEEEDSTPKIFKSSVRTWRRMD